MKTKITFSLAAGLILLGTQTVFAEPMKCSGEEKTCNTNCIKIARAAVARCMETCRSSRLICLRTGCWDTGTSRYCGLTKQ